MKNREKFADKIIEIATSGESLAKVKGELRCCKNLFCKQCDFHKVGKDCREVIKEWAEQEYIEEPYVDWTKVPVDTPVLVSRDGENDWKRRYFKYYSQGMFFTYESGLTSWTGEGSVESWKYAKKPDDISDWLQEETDDEKAIQAET